MKDSRPEIIDAEWHPLPSRPLNRFEQLWFIIRYTRLTVSWPAYDFWRQFIAETSPGGRRQWRIIGRWLLAGLAAVGLYSILR